MWYKSYATTEKTFYGVTFKPGDVKDVSGYIHDKHFMTCEAPEKVIGAVETPKENITTVKRKSKLRKDDKNGSDNN